MEFLSGLITAVVFLAGLAAVITHYLYGGLRIQGGGPRLTQAARIHLGTLAALFLLLRAVDYWLSRFALSTKDSRLITGLTYTDANAVLTAKAVLSAISVIVAALFLVVAAVGPMAAAAAVRRRPARGVRDRRRRRLPRGGATVPGDSEREDAGVQVHRAQHRGDPGRVRAEPGRDHLPGQDPGARPARCATTPSRSRASGCSTPHWSARRFRQLEQNKQYYSFPDSLDVDRYTIDGKVRDTVIAVRELDIDRVPPGQRNWVNDHLALHARLRRRGRLRQPADRRRQAGVLPVRASPRPGQLGSYEPRVYFGEQSPNYSIVGAPPGAPPQELDFPDDNSPTGQQNTTYTGKGGVPIGSEFTRLLYAIKFREQNILLSDQVNSELADHVRPRSRAQRVEKVAPYLTLDGDPYPAVVDGRIVWIVDGYTTTNHYPYSRLQVLDEATADSLTATSSSVVALQAQQVNYMRNSVKATVDAYDGSVTLYAWDESDPLLQGLAEGVPGDGEAARRRSAAS